MISLFDSTVQTDGHDTRLPITWHGIDYNAMTDTEWTEDPSDNPLSFLHVQNQAWSTPFTFASEVEPDIVKTGGGVEIYDLRTASRVLSLQVKLAARTLSERDAWINEIQGDFSPLKLAWLYSSSWPPANTTGRPDFVDQLPLQFYRMNDGTHQASLKTTHPDGRIPLEYHVIPLEEPDPILSDVQPGGYAALLNLRFLVIDGGRAYAREDTTLTGDGNIVPTFGPAPNFPTFSWTMTGAGNSAFTITSSGVSGYTPAPLVFDLSGLTNEDVVVNCRDRIVYVDGAVDYSILVSGDFPLFGGYGDTNAVAWTNTTNTTSRVTTFREAMWH